MATRFRVDSDAIARCLLRGNQYDTDALVRNTVHRLRQVADNQSAEAVADKIDLARSLYDCGLCDAALSTLRDFDNITIVPRRFGAGFVMPPPFRFVQPALLHVM